MRGISRKGTPKPEATFNDYLSADPCNPNEEVISRVRSASVIVSCVPPGPCVRALEALAPYMSEGCLFLDVLSVKTEICNSYNQLKVLCTFRYTCVMNAHVGWGVGENLHRIESRAVQLSVALRCARTLRLPAFDPLSLP